MSGKKRKKRKTGRWALGIGCMLISAGAFAAVIYFSNAGRLESETGETETQTAEETQEQTTEETEQEESLVDQKIEEWTLEDKIAQMFLITPDALTGVEGTWNPGDVTEESFNERPVGGLVMTESNLVSPDQILTWNNAVTGFSKAAVGVEPFLAVEEDGTEASLIAGNAAFDVEDTADLSEIGASGDAGGAYSAGQTIGAYLSELGFNMDLAPMADVGKDTSDLSGQYSTFGADPESVSEMVAEMVKGLRSEGIYTAAKRFPGQGGICEGTVSLNSTEEELRACEFLPFQAAAEAGTECMIVGSCSLPEILGDETPACLSETVIEKMLREELGYEGIVITDALDQEAITSGYSSAEAAVQAVQAGADMICMPQNFEDAYQGILSAVKSGSITEDRIDESVRRILEVKMSGSGEKAS